MNTTRSAGNLADTLRNFNRKERYWVYREILGHDQEVPLSESFREKLRSHANGVPVPSSKAWWSTDFHFDWLIAGIYHQSKGCIDCDDRKIVRYLKGNQEDIDLIICEGNKIWLGEAKFGSELNKKQINSKHRRVKTLINLIKRLPVDVELYVINLYARQKQESAFEACHLSVINYNMSTHRIDGKSDNTFSTVKRTGKEEGKYTRFKIKTDLSLS